MSSRAIKPKRDLSAERAGWQTVEERAPSIMREEGSSFPRYIAVAGLMLITLGGAALLFNAWGWPYLISPGWGMFLLAFGLGGLQYHAFVESDLQFRRLYGVLGFLLLVIAVFLRFVPVTRDTPMGGSFLPYGALSLFLALGFLLSFIKNEAESALRNYALAIVGITAAVNALAGFVGCGLLSTRLAEGFLMPSGVLHLIFGLLYGIGYAGSEGINTKRGFLAGQIIGVFAVAMIAVALLRSLAPFLWDWLSLGGVAPSPFFLPSGLVLLYIGVEYLFIYLGICSDRKLIVLTRRELASFFTSPIIYIVMIGMTVVGWLNFSDFVGKIEMGSTRGGSVPEPIFLIFILSFLFIIPMVFLVPITTMRMLSEEKRTGTMEMLLTAPVNEWQIVLAKFFAGMRVFLLSWYIWGLFLVALWVEGGPFDYRPIVTFWMALVCLTANFIALGLFFSSVTRHQILAAVLTFSVMMLLTIIFFISQSIQNVPWLSFLLTYVSYIDLWISAARSTITPRLLVLNISFAVFWLFLTIKVLEARKWS